MTRAWALRPVDTFIVKLTERCNLGCSYCYMFEYDKTISRELPAVMSPDIFHQLLVRIREHVADHSVPTVTLALHGGEPLLRGTARMRQYLGLIRTALAGLDHRLTLQTNGVLLDEAWLDLFQEHGVSFALSLDGPAASQNTWRPDKQGRPTFERALGALHLIQAHPAADLFGGVLAVIDPHADGAETMEFFLAESVRKLDFLLPDLNHTHAAAADWPLSRVGDFLISAFDVWLAADDPAVDVRLFRQIMMGLLGRRPRLDTFGNIDGALASVETDGGLLPHDVLRICGPPWDRSTVNVYHDRIDALIDDALYPWARLADQCTSCALLDVCGGGYPPHRWDGVSFQNPSAYCQELQRVIRHIGRETTRRIPRSEADRYPLLATALAAC